jgi:hypothetical protein
VKLKEYLIGEHLYCKAKDVEKAIRQEREAAVRLFVYDLFPVGPDGKRHPTRRELDDCHIKPAGAAVLALLERLRDVAPEDYSMGKKVER